ncbi:unnamed protein product [Cercopithifilaria johnstoni]|uniref:Uncharacterized protein n=1 Tax=Cercopithifilaria johnstoni TaxID=2874296 RepID=A0A8J2PUD2_9BILA|nr:unnamed protein product [Cercopithifilaria johnstoni]
MKVSLQVKISEKLCDRSNWYTPSFIVVCLIIANATLIITIIVVAIHLAKEVNYRSEKEFLLHLQRAYDTAIYSLFGVLIFYIIINFISLGIRLKVIKDSVNYISEQVNQQRKECEETARRFVRDTFFVKKYYENGPATFKPAEILSAQEAVSKYKEMKKEHSVDKTMEEISKHLTTLNKMKIVMNQPTEKQFDSKFIKLIEEQIARQKDASSIIQESQLSRTQEEFSRISTITSVGQKYKSQYTNLSIKGQKSQIIDEKTEPSALETPTGQITETASEHRKSVLSQSRLSPESHIFQSQTSKVASKILRIFETEKTQSSSHRRNQENIHRESTDSENYEKMKVSMSSEISRSESESIRVKTNEMINQQEIGRAENENDDKMIK